MKRLIGATVLVLLCCICSTSSLAQAQNIKVLFIGDSITAGYGISKNKAYPALVEKMLHEENFSHVTIINGGISGSTTASGESRLRWFKKAKPQVLVLALGANDGLRGFKLEESKKYLGRTIELAKKMGMKIVLAGMKLPTNYGPEYREKFESVFPTVAKRYQVPLLPFLLEGVGGHPDLNLADGIHPNEKGHEVIATTVVQFLKPYL